MKRFGDIISWTDQLDPFYLEQLRTLRSKVIHMLEGLGKKIIGISSSLPEEGKTSISLNLASSIAAIGDKRVILIDCDMRKCDLTMIMGLRGETGLSHYLGGADDKIESIVRNSKMKNLYVISSGRKVQNAAELLTQAKFQSLMDVLRKNFDLIIMDLPPVLNTADPMAVREIVDKFIIVYFAGKTPIDIFENSINEIGRDKILGVVLNAVDMEKIIKYKKYYQYYY
jgi:capsular exopolysaccharide synthesis family protein